MKDVEGSYRTERRETIAEAPGLRVRLLVLAEGDCVPWHLHTAITDTFFCMEGPMQVWTRIEERLSRTSSLSPPVMRFKNAVNYYGQCASLDGQGRILIHPLLRDKAGTVGEVAVLGQQEYLEVWNRAAFEERLERDPLTDEDLGILAESGI